MDFSKRWSFKLPNPDAALPRGAFEFFVRAMACLSAENSFHRDEAAKNELCTCISCAANEIQNLAVSYNSQVILNKSAPRAKGVFLQIEAVHDRAKGLLEVILALDDFARAELDKYVSFSGLDLPVRAGYFEDGEDHEDSDTQWVQHLQTLIGDSDAAMVGFRRSRGAEGESIDKGGNTNLYKEQLKSPDFNLVVDGWRLFEKFKPNEARGTEGGSFHVFLQCIFEYATGREAEFHSGITTSLKALAGPLRLLDDLLNKRALLANWPDFPDESEEEKRFRKQRADDLEKEILRAEAAISRTRGVIKAFKF